MTIEEIEQEIHRERFWTAFYSELATVAPLARSFMDQGVARSTMAALLFAPEGPGEQNLCDRAAHECYLSWAHVKYGS
jgi:hypothetical protein